MNIYKDACTAIADCRKRYYGSYSKKSIDKMYKYSKSEKDSLTYLNKTTGSYGTQTYNVVEYVIDNGNIRALKGFVSTNYLRFIKPCEKYSRDDNGELQFACGLLKHVIMTSFTIEQKMEMIKILVESQYKNLFLSYVQRSCEEPSTGGFVFEACCLDSDKIFKYFINNGININIHSKNHDFGEPDTYLCRLIRSALYTSYDGDVICKCLRRYLAFGADPNIRWNGQTPLQLALCHGDNTIELAKILMCNEKTNLMTPDELRKDFEKWNKIVSCPYTSKYVPSWLLSNEQMQLELKLLRDFHFVRHLRRFIIICNNKYVSEDIFTFVTNLYLYT